MERVLIAGIISMVISIIAGPKFIQFLRRNEFGQHIREEGPQHHVVKQGTPTMGGLLIVLSMSVAFLALSRYTTEGLVVFSVTLGCAGIGFIDDFIKLRHRRSLGLAGRWKLLFLAGIALFAGILIERKELASSVYVPGLDWRFDLSWAWYVLVFLIIAGAANGVNLTDGIDGLAAGTGMIALMTFTAINVFTFVRSRQPGGGGEADIAALDVSILGAALIGATIGFLWYNAFPAEVFMGDTGSMAIGGALAAFSVITNAELLLILVGGIFVIEALSVMMQVFSFKYWGRRIFLMTPIHHHFEMKAWSETKIMVRFWILGAILGAAAFALYFRYFFDFRPDLGP
ncbi:MAG: phospho-N-acetylmuramoyl-pentapeptide-transferase [Actinobacteria bacterium]|nr:phospho-N-acetylmuramoyl-pentapeptide-transferase [Actinomycetota bacterium]